ncbi:MAG TPA: hypothetical protein VGG34_06150 [Opitutaceae bacterium]|jgi:hypothetical protein
MRSLRILMVCVSLFLVFSGVTAMLNPRPLVVAHGGVSEIFGAAALPYRIETLSVVGTYIYGAMATATGVIFFYLAGLGDLRVARRDREVARRIAQAAPELQARYGSVEGCTQAQIEATLTEMNVDARFLPYLLAAFMGRDALRTLVLQNEGIDWLRVEACVERICAALPTAELRHGQFHGSWSGPLQT